MSTGNATLDALSDAADGYVGVTTDATKIRDWLLYAALQDLALVVSKAAVPVGTTQVLYTNQQLRTLLKYPDTATYAAAVQAAGFVDPADVAVVERHIRHGSSATYDARLLKGDGSGYRKCRLQGFTFGIGTEVFRISLFS